MKLAKHCLTTQTEVKSKSCFQENRQRMSQFKFYSQQIQATYSLLVSILTCADVCKDNCAPKVLLCFISGCIFRNCCCFLLKHPQNSCLGRDNVLKTAGSAAARISGSVDWKKLWVSVVPICMFFPSKVFLHICSFKSLSRLINIFLCAWNDTHAYGLFEWKYKCHFYDVKRYCFYFIFFNCKLKCLIFKFLNGAGK